jgi:hypothetical protein
MKCFDPLTSWNDGSAIQPVLAFVNDITDESSPTFQTVSLALMELLAKGND